MSQSDLDVKKFAAFNKLCRSVSTWLATEGLSLPLERSAELANGLLADAPNHAEAWLKEAVPGLNLDSGDPYYRSWFAYCHDGLSPSAYSRKLFDEAKARRGWFSPSERELAAELDAVKIAWQPATLIALDRAYRAAGANGAREWLERQGLAMMASAKVFPLPANDPDVQRLANGIEHYRREPEGHGRDHEGAPADYKP